MHRYFSTWTASLLLLASVATAQTEATEHTLALTDSTAGLGIGLEHMAILEGTWRGEGLGGVVEEMWTRPVGDQMHGLFRLIHDDNITLTEHMVIDLADGRPTLRVKHFSNTFEAWEEKAESVDFPLVQADEGALYFNGLTIKANGPDSLIYYLVMGGSDGVREETMTYHRVK